MNIEQARFNMIEQQIRPWEVLDQGVLSLLSIVKREDFVPPEYRSMAFVDTLEEQHVGLHHGSAIHRFLLRKAELAGQGYSPRIQVGSFEAICLMIEAGVGVGVLPASSAQRLSRALRITTVPLADAWAERELKIIARNREHLPASARELFDYLAG